MSAEQLTEGVIARMLDSSDADAPVDPVCQVLSLKKLQTNSANSNVSERYRVVLSDGVYYTQAMLATQLKPLVEDHTLDRNMVVRISQYTSNTVQNRKILILLNLEILSPALPNRLGNPQNIEAVQANGDGVAAKPAASAPSLGAQALSRGGKAASGVGKPSSGLPVYPIEALSPYQNKWTIKARVTLKSDVKHWSNARGDGKLFSVNLLDESGEIRATGFNDAVDRFYPMLQENKVYFISKAKVNIAKKQFSNLSNEYEIALESNSEIEECAEGGDVPEVKYQFVPIEQLGSVEPNQTTDVIAILDEYSEVSEIVSKATQRPIKKRELTLMDSSGMSVRLTLWGQQAENFEKTIAGDDKPVLAFKGVKVGDFGGRSLSMFSSSSMTVNPDMPESHGLRGWYDNEGNAAQIRSFTKVDVGGAGAGGGGGGAMRPDERRTLEQVKESSLGASFERADYFNTRATILYIRPNSLYYTACPECNKKVIDEGDGWRCEKCDRSWPAPVRRYIFSANIADYSGQIWISGFNEIGERIIGMRADELDAIRNENENEFKAVLQRGVGKMMLFSCRAKQETFNDTNRVRYTVTQAHPVDFTKAGHELCEGIQALHVSL
ncbi:Replication factor A protein 1 [Malassezia vespertilionis]|uniref:Replication factor A protein 1 n=1 Tax=Malassezia vespertilionis TaxID=2020962 RepID=UPI0024B12C94|nr:Replication factor A protein 1 [Malassezia vespertilionis]WFD05638.1 Replication factor A protein 1 [Malassezia vespertilionis]